MAGLTPDEFASQVLLDGFRVRHVVGELQSGARAVSPHNSGSFGVLGVEPLYAEIRTVPVESGRFLVDRDNEEEARVAVIGDKSKTPTPHHTCCRPPLMPGRSGTAT